MHAKCRIDANALPYATQAGARRVQDPGWAARARCASDRNAAIGAAAKLGCGFDRLESLHRGRRQGASATRHRRPPRERRTGPDSLRQGALPFAPRSRAGGGPPARSVRRSEHPAQYVRFQDEMMIERGQGVQKHKKGDEGLRRRVNPRRRRHLAEPGERARDGHCQNDRIEKRVRGDGSEPQNGMFAFRRRRSPPNQAQIEPRQRQCENQNSAGHMGIGERKIGDRFAAFSRAVDALHGLVGRYLKNDQRRDYPVQQDLRSGISSHLNPRSFGMPPAARTGTASASGRLRRWTASRNQASATIILAAFSAIMIVGEFVLPDVIVGIMDASATRSPERPRSRRRSSTTAMSSLPMRHVPTG